MKLFKRYLPFTVAIISILGTLLLWASLSSRERSHTEARISMKAQAVRDDIKIKMESRIYALVRMGKRFERGPQTREDWKEDASLYISHYRGYEAIGFAGPDYRVRWIVPLEGNENVVGFDIRHDEKRRKAVDEARDKRDVRLSDPVDLVTGTRGFLAYVPVFSRGEFGGFVVGAFRTGELFDEILQTHRDGGEYAFALVAGGDVLYASGTDTEYKDRFQKVESLDLFGLPLRVQVWPTREYIAEAGSVLPAVVLGSGIVISLVLALTVHFAQTARRREEDIRLFSNIIEGSPLTVVITDPQGSIQYVNPDFTKTTGYTAQEVIGHNPRLLKSGLQPPEFYKDLWGNITSGRGWRGDFQNRDKNGRIYWERAFIFPMKDKRGEIKNFVAIKENITDLKEYEEALERHAAELERSNKELEQFAYIASHDLQEPLRIVAGYVQLLKKRYAGKLETDADEFIEYAVEGTKRMQSLISDLLAYSRVGRKKELLVVDTGRVLERTIQSLKASVEESGAKVTSDGLPEVYADEVQFEQLFLNLLSNAIKYRSKNPPAIHVSAEKDSHEWLFSVRDNGIGIDPKYSEKIFEIFQRLHGKFDYSGTGIGLAICKKVVENHGGRIWVDSTPEVGSTFYFTIPIRRG